MPANNQRKTVLVVEDSPVQALAVLKLLEREGLNIICAPNGSAGVAMARENRPDAIILDVQMPEMNGIEACRAIKADPLTTNIPVVMFTAFTELDTLKDSLLGGAVDFIPKDAFYEVVLVETLRQLGILPPATEKLEESEQ
jgi:CheY-like chemotaxis protein